tara:strand:- start:83 stop:265 length:183 start_codon:yes stop_codon:yes gene_type:complete
MSSDPNHEIDWVITNKTGEFLASPILWKADPSWAKVFDTYASARKYLKEHKLKGSVRHAE